MLDETSCKKNSPLTIFKRATLPLIDQFLDPIIFKHLKYDIVVYNVIKFSRSMKKNWIFMKKVSDFKNC